MRLVRSLVPLALLLVLSACGGSSSTPEKKDNTTATETPAVPLTTVDPATAGTIEGTISFDGVPPADKVIDTKADPTCGRAHREPLYTETAVVADGKVRWAFVRISGGLEGKSFGVPSEPVVVDQEGCVYVPHVVGVVTGQTIQVLNSDETLHNVNAVCAANKRFNMAMPLKGMKQEKKFATAEMVHFKCDVHPWMSAYIGVCDNPFYAVSEADGGYVIRNVPPGDYTVEVWHETFGKLTMPVTVLSSGSARADFTFKAAS
ncbi:MAG TPA: carboxypeptidase regulatory-like domain-containing protein [Candidatus Eisenbacteria bacterium]